DDLLHLSDARGRARLIGRGEDAEGTVPGGELELHAVGECPPLLRLGGVREDLVVDVGDVAHEGDVVAAPGDPAAPQVVDEGRAQVPDVRRRLHGGSADVDAHATWLERFEVEQLLGTGVVEAHGHAPKLIRAKRGTTRPTDASAR